MITQSQGFTLLEFIIAMTLFVIMATLAAPNFIDLVNRNRLSSSVETLYRDLILARSEAIRRNHRVTMCQSANRSTASPQCTNSTDWGLGWIVFSDNLSVKGRFETGEELIANTGIADNLKITGNSLIANSVSFVASGRAQAANGSLQSGTFTATLKKTGRPYQQKLVISNTGRPRIEKLEVLSDE